MNSATARYNDFEPSSFSGFLFPGFCDCAQNDTISFPADLAWIGRLRATMTKKGVRFSKKTGLREKRYKLLGKNRRNDIHRFNNGRENYWAE